MAKIKILKYDQALMTQIYSYDLTEPTNDNYNSIKAYCISFILLMGIVCSAFHTHSNSFVFKTEVNSLMAIIGLSHCLGVYHNMGLKLKKVKVLHLKLQGIVDEGVEEEVYNIYWKTEKNGRKYSMALIAVILYFLLPHIIVLFQSFYNIFTGDVDTSTWPVLYDVFPFDTNSIPRWYLMWCTAFSLDLVYGLTMASITSHFISSCLYMCGMCDHFKYLMQTVHDNIELNQREENPRKHERRHRKIKEQMHKAIELHGKLFEIFNAVSDITSGSIFAILPSNAIFIGLTMYNMENSISNMDTTAAFTAILYLICSLIWPYLFCHFASIVIDRISSIGNIAYDSNWPDYPPELRKYIILIIAYSQQPMEFNGLKMIGCSLEVFGAIFKSSCSYYLVFRQFQQL